jgi:hypothetical protein
LWFFLLFSIVLEKRRFEPNMHSEAILVLNLSRLGQPRVPQERL